MRNLPRVARLLPLLVICGCGSGDPGSGRLASGSRAMLYAPHADRVTVTTESNRGDLGTGWARVSVGSEVTVVSDEQGEGGDERPVKVNVAGRDGEYRGPGVVPRNALRPAGD